MTETAGVRRTRVLKALSIPTSSWYRRRAPGSVRRRPGPFPAPLDGHTEAVVKKKAEDNPAYGYQRIAIMCRRDGEAVANRDAYRVMKAHGLLQMRVRHEAEMRQASKLFDLLPQGVNELWQSDVTYIHIPDDGWWYGVSVIDYYSRYLLALHLAPSFCAQEVIAALRLACEEAARCHGALTAPPRLVTDNGPSYTSKRFGTYVQDRFRHHRIRYRTPTQIGLVERFNKTLKTEEVYRHVYDSGAQAKERLAAYRTRYNTHRPHWALQPEGGGDPVTPHEVYVDGIAVGIPAWQPWARQAKAKLDRLRQEAA